jgi:photosystem II stability/assembly factor-like uncharacterized protein
MHPSRLSVLILAATTLANAQSPAPVWQMQDSGTTASLRGIDSVDGKVAWASGTEGTVLKTIDGGAHWTQCSIPDADKDGATLDFRGVQAWDSDTAIVMASGPGDKSRLYKTTDGCKTWSLLFSDPDKDGFFDAISVADKNNLMLLGDPVGGRFTIFDTIDGGKNWIRDASPTLANNSKEGGFAASNSSLLVNGADGPAAFATGSPSGARLFIKCDTCGVAKKWAVVPLAVFPHAEAAGVFALSQRDWKHWAAVGGDYTKPNDTAGTAACSANGGSHWAASAKPPHGYRSTVQWSETEKIWITAGTNGSDLSRDDGRTWQPLDNGNWNALSLPFIVGPKGRIARLNPASLPKP